MLAMTIKTLLTWRDKTAVLTRTSREVESEARRSSLVAQGVIGRGRKEGADAEKGGSGRGSSGESYKG